MTASQVIDDVMRREGWPAVTERAADRGGLTKGGVTIVNYNAWLAKFGGLPLTRNEFVGLSATEARSFFDAAYCAPFRFVDHEETFAFIADWSVNAGVDDPTLALQITLKERGLYAAALDGDPGPKTRAGWKALPMQDREAVRLALIAERIEFHLDRGFDREAREYVRTHPTSQLTNLRGWMNRCVEFLK